MRKGRQTMKDTELLWKMNVLVVSIQGSSQTSNPLSGPFQKIWVQTCLLIWDSYQQFFFTAEIMLFPDVSKDDVAKKKSYGHLYMERVKGNLILYLASIFWPKMPEKSGIKS